MHFCAACPPGSALCVSTRAYSSLACLSVFICISFAKGCDSHPFLTWARFPPVAWVELRPHKMQTLRSSPLAPRMMSWFRDGTSQMTGRRRGHGAPSPMTQILMKRGGPARAVDAGTTLCADRSFAARSRGPPGPEHALPRHLGRRVASISDPWPSGLREDKRVFWCLPRLTSRFQIVRSSPVSPPHAGTRVQVVEACPVGSAVTWGLQIPRA